jgi:hypothetical protein
MIPERNLLKGIAGGEDKDSIVNFLSGCLEDGGSIILKIPKLYCCISIKIAEPHILSMFGSWRDKVEHYCLMCDIITASSINSDLTLQIGLDGGTRDYVKQILKDSRTKLNIFFHAMPDFVSLLLAGKSHKYIDELYRKRIKLLYIL